MGGRHRFAGEDRTVRPLLAAVVPVVAVCGITVAVLLGSSGSATSTPRIEVPRFSSDASDAPAPTAPVALPAVLPATTPSLRDVSGSGVAAVRKLADERAEAAARAERERAAAARAAQARAALEQQAAAQRAAQAQAAQQRPATPATPAAPATPAPAATTEPPAATPSETRDEPEQRATPERPRGLLGSLLGGG